MYSNERGSRFNFLDLLVKIIFFVLFVFVLIWLFPKVPNMTPFYSNVFRENISYMQDAGEAYFTDERKPNEVGEEVKISLSELFSKKLVLPFVDKDGNSCNQYDSYVSITKSSEEEYSLKTNLVCNSESDYLVKILGCYNYCKDNECEKTCYKEQITEYQYKKSVSNMIASYSCDSGYTRDGKYCYKSVLKDSKSAEITVVVDQTLTMAPKVTYIEATRVKLNVITEELPDIKKEVRDSLVVTPKKCETITKPTYSCNCTTTYYKGVAKTTCDTCGGGTYESCDDGPKYDCPSYSTNSSGSGTSKICWHYTTVDGGYSYSCPLETNDKTGSGSTLQCYKVTEAKTLTECTDKTYTLKNGVCIKVIHGSSTEYKCDDAGYVLEGKVCNLYGTDKKNANFSSSSKISVKYTWSRNTSLSGWTKTNKTRTVEGKEICE